MMIYSIIKRGLCAPEQAPNKEEMVLSKQDFLYRKKSVKIGLITLRTDVVIAW